jgi:hypothetical protein
VRSRRAGQSPNDKARFLNVMSRTKLGKLPVRHLEQIKSRGHAELLVIAAKLGVAMLTGGQKPAPHFLATPCKIFQKELLPPKGDKL